MPPKPSFLALGDIHLDPLIWRRHRDITGDAEASWMSFIDHAINLKIPIVIVGDLFDSIDPPTTMVQVFRESMEICQANGVEVFAIQGNHDKRLPIPWYCAVSPHPRHFGDGTLTMINGIKTVGIDYSTQDVIQERLATITSQIDQNPVQVLFLHQAVKQGLKFQDAWNCDINWVPDAIPLVILGDLHAPIDIPRDKGHALYTGSSHPRSLAEVGQKSCVLVHDDLSVTRLPLATRSIAVTSLTPMDDLLKRQGELLEWKAKLPNAKLKPVAWIRYSEGLQDAAAQLAAVVQDCAIIVYDPMQVIGSTEHAIEASDFPTLPTLLGRCLDPNEFKTEYRLAMGLLDQSNDPNDFIRSVREQFVNERHATTPLTSKTYGD